MAQQKYTPPTPDALLGANSKATEGKSVVIGQIVKAENRGNNRQGQPYKQNTLNLNVNAFREAIANGDIVVSEKGYVNLTFTFFTPDQKAQYAAKRNDGGQNQQHQGGGQNNWNNQGNNNQQGGNQQGGYPNQQQKAGSKAPF